MLIQTNIPLLYPATIIVSAQEDTRAICPIVVLAVTFFMNQVLNLHLHSGQSTF